MYIDMYKYIDNYVNTNHVTQSSYPTSPLLLYSRDLVVSFRSICKAQNYCYFTICYYFVLPYYISIVTTPVH